MSTTMPTGPAAGTATPGTSTGPTGPTPPGGGGSDPITSFFDTLITSDFSIIAPVSEPEAEEAITLFSVANVLLAGKGERVVGSDRKVDVLGILTLYYGLQDRSLTSKIVVRSQTLFSQIDTELKDLRDELDRLGSDVTFLEREAKRQFNLGRNNDVVANAEFPRLFKRYVEIANDPLVFLNLQTEKDSTFSDKEKVGKAFDLLRELKDVIIQVVRSLSKYGTVATTRANKDWAGFEARAMAVLKSVADLRLSDDIDEQRPLAVLADLTGKNFDTQIAPYVALAREGGQLLNLAMETYRATKDNLEDYSEDSLIQLFQTPNTTFVTTRMRRSAAIIRAFPLRDWMV
jgi:hypothetical protein